MGFFDGRNYRINKILLSTIGQWPYQSPRTNHTVTIVLATIACSQFLAKLCGLFSCIHDMDAVIECLTPIMVDVSSFVKIMNSVLYMNEIRALLDQIHDDFHSVRYSSKIEILRKYADNGRKFTVIYVSECIICPEEKLDILPKVTHRCKNRGVMYMVMIVFMLMPFQSLILRVANTTTRPILHRVEYYIDMDKYYLPILIHGYFTTAICVSTIIATDSIFIILVQHICGLFVAIGLHIERAIQEEHLAGDADPPVTKDMAYRNMVRCVYDHKAALRFANLMEVAYSKYFLFHAWLNMVAMSIAGVGALGKLNNPTELARLVAVSWSLLFHLFLECLSAQRLMDYSAYLHTNLINLNWYDASPRTKKLILYMTMKTQSPCVLTAGGMFVLCMETFATIVKTAVSYFTVLRSTQQTSFSEI